ncbi:MAG: glycosyltransferase [Desulfobacterales bacterium]
MKSNTVDTVSEEPNPKTGIKRMADFQRILFSGGFFSFISQQKSWFPAFLVCIIFSISMMISERRSMLFPEDIINGFFGKTVICTGVVFLLIHAAGLIWRMILFHRYRPIPVVSDEQLPSCTVLVPAFNEGRQVLLTLKSLVTSDYPPNRMEIIAVDDGSADSTWSWIKKAESEFPGRIKAMKLPVNKGKRHALHAGILKSSGEILVTVDSDSVVLARTLRNLVGPFICDGRVGAVAGNVRVLNRRHGIIPRMLDVVFIYSFDFIRAGQSVVKTVMCTPGALSAYRRSAAMTVLDEWLNQTFFGRPANIGEDRAMTNLILREGFHVLFQQNATVYTNVPTDYAVLCKMFLRWARSNIRETLAMSRFAFRRFRRGSMLGARVNLILGWISLIRSPLFFFTAAALALFHPQVFGMTTVAGIIIFSSLMAGLYLLQTRRIDALWAYAYGAFWILGLSWIMPYALVTPHRSGWLTRQLEHESYRVRTPILKEKALRH